MLLCISDSMLLSDTLSWSMSEETHAEDLYIYSIACWVMSVETTLHYLTVTEEHQHSLVYCISMLVHVWYKQSPWHLAVLYHTHECLIRYECL